MRRTVAHTALVLLLAFAASPAPVDSQAPAVAPYLVLDTAKTSTMQTELQAAADKGYRLVAGQGSWLLSAILEKAPSEVEAIRYVLLATAKSGTMQKEMAASSARGYRFASVLGIGREVTIVMERPKGSTAPTHEYALLATTKIGTMMKEIGAETAKGFRFVGQTVFAKPEMLGGDEYVAIMQRPLK